MQYYMKRKVSFLSLSILLFFLSGATAQTVRKADTPNNNIIPPSPEASALGKYGEIPIGLYTGTPRISFPLWEITEGDITVPLGLSYHASGHKIEEIAPRTGMGWTLEGGGVITRTVRGKADEFVNGFLTFTKKLGSPDNFHKGTAHERYLKYDALARLCEDAEPDQFFFNFMGLTGQFSFDWNGNLVVNSEQQLTVTPLGMNVNTLDYIDGWEVKGADGTVYLFEESETTFVRNWGDTFPCDTRMAPTTSWYLSKVTSPLGNVVLFEYIPHNLAYSIFGSETAAHRMESYTANPTRSMLQLEINGKVLNRIYSPSGSFQVDFIASRVRTDLTDVMGSTQYSLDEIIVSGHNNVKVKHFKLEYDYSVNRLTLRKIHELSTKAADINIKPPYSFDYEGPLPVRGSGTINMQDHWGFYNSNGSPHLVPPIVLEQMTTGDLIYQSGGDRTPDPNKMKAGMLKKITYPTGGSTSFDFEPHDYSHEGSVKLYEYKIVPKGENASISGNGKYEIRYTDTPFTVGQIASPHGAVKFTYSAIMYSESTLGGRYAPNVEIFKSSGERIISSGINTGHKYLKLEPGDYFIRVTACLGSTDDSGALVQGDYAAGSVDWEEKEGVPIPVTKIGGGVRIKETVDFDGIDETRNLVRRYQYKLDGAMSNLSSGSIMGEPVYTYKTQIHEHDPNLNPDDMGVNAIPYLIRMSSGKSALGVTQGSNVGYSRVTVYQGVGLDNGKIVSEFTSPQSFPDYINTSAPFSPPTAHEYRRGLLLKESVYKSDNGGFTLVKQVENYYTHTETLVPALKVGYAISGGGEYSENTLDRYAFGHYTYNLGRSRLSSTRESVFSGAQMVTSQNQFDYDEKLQFLIRTSTSLSDGSKEITEFYYPHNYSSSATINLLKQKHIFSPVIEKVTKVRSSDSEDEKVVDAEFMEYGQINGLVLPSVQYKFQSATPVADLKLSKDFAGAFDTRYYRNELSFNRYNTFGKPLQLTSKESMVVVYLWGYNQALPIAEVKNASHGQVFHSNFEDKAGWGGNVSYDGSRSRTGVVSGKMHNTSTGEMVQLSDQWLDISLTAPKKFRYSAWYYSEGPSAEIFLFMKRAGETGYFTYIDQVVKSETGKWVLLEGEVEVPADVTQLNIRLDNNGTGTVWFDDVRLYPADAYMTTYTYDPLVGVKSVTDANGKTLFYEYDGFGRLWLVKDHEGNVLQTYEYNYAGQQ